MKENTLNRVADAALNEPVKLEIDVKAKNYLHKVLQKIGWLKTKEKFEISGINMGTLIKVSRIVIGIDTSFFTKDNLLESNFKAMDKYGEDLAKCIAHCIHNKKSEPPQALINFILFNFTSTEMYRVLGIVIKQMDVSSFMSSIISIKGVNILVNPDANVQPVKEMSLQPGEIIAPGQPSEE